MLKTGEAKLITLGVDLKITPSGEVGLIEINGHTSGFEGFLKIPKHANFREERSKIKLSLAKVHNRDLQEELQNGVCINAQESSRIFGIGEGLQTRLLKFRDGRGSVEKERQLLLRVQSILDSLVNKYSSLQNGRKALRAMHMAELMPTERMRIMENEVPIDYFEKRDPSKLLLEELKRYFGIYGFGFDAEIGLIVIKIGGELMHFNSVFDLKDFDAHGAFENARNEFLSQLFEAFPVRSRKVLTSRAEMNYIFNPSHERIFVEDRLFCPNNPEQIEEAAGDKLQQKSFVDEKNLAPYIVWNGEMRYVKMFIENLKRRKHRLIDVEKFPFLVAKPRVGTQGNDVRIFNLDDLEGIENFLQGKTKQSFLLEGFVPSKDVIVNSSEQGHDASMRYFMDILTVQEGTRVLVEPVFEKAYFRVSKSSMGLSGVSLEDKFRVNLCQGALALACDDKDIAKVQKVARTVTERIIRNEPVWSATKPLDGTTRDVENKYLARAI